MLLRQGLWPQRDVLAQLLRDEEGWLADETKVYLRDAYQHSVQVLELTESYREMAAGLLDIYLSSASRRLIEVMRVLTVFATIFLSLTFIAGIYGMNFTQMPELDWRYGYPLTLALMGGVAVGLLTFFQRKGRI